MTAKRPVGHPGLGAMGVARVMFLVLAAGFGWWGLKDHRHEIAEVISRTSPFLTLAATAAVCLGLAITAALWWLLLAGFGQHLPWRHAGRIFFVGQLGKYIPGSVWAVGAQASMARQRVRPRTTVAVYLLFVLVSVATAAPFALLVPQVSRLPLVASPLIKVLLCLMAVLAMSPKVMSFLAARLDPASEPYVLGWREVGLLWVGMALVWTLFGLAMWLVVPDLPAGTTGVSIPLAAGAFALSYLVGLLVILAPAGLGAREATLIAVLEPSIGFSEAAAVALLIRVIHTGSDFGLAGLAALLSRRREPLEARGEPRAVDPSLS